MIIYYSSDRILFQHLLDFKQSCIEIFFVKIRKFSEIYCLNYNTKLINKDNHLGAYPKQSVLKYIGWIKNIQYNKKYFFFNFLKRRIFQDNLHVRKCS